MAFLLNSVSTSSYTSVSLKYRKLKAKEEEDEEEAANEAREDEEKEGGVPGVLLATHVNFQPYFLRLLRLSSFWPLL